MVLKMKTIGHGLSLAKKPLEDFLREIYGKLFLG